MTIPKWKFFLAYGAKAIGSEQRSGQFLFTLLQQENPTLAEQIRGTELDPFYDDNKIDMCCQWVEKNWQ